MNDLTDKVVWITGASTGIGRALVRSYLDKGCSVVASSRSISEPHFTAEELATNRLTLLPGDVSLERDNRRLVHHIMEQFGRIDVAILNAGSNAYVTVDSFRSEVFESLMKANFLSVVYGLEALLPHMKDKSGCIAVMSSVVAYGGLPRAGAYGATKAALRSMVQSMQVELAYSPLQLSLVCPGFVKTPLTDKNDFKMPFIISPEEAAKRIVSGLAKQKLEVHFPYRMSLFLKGLMSLPQSWVVKLLSRFVPLTDDQR